MNTATTTTTTDFDNLVKLPVQAPKPVESSPLMERLVSVHGATWLDAESVQPWSELGGDRVVLFAGDPVRFPEGQDVAVVLPELRRCVPGGFAIGIVPRPLEEAVARRYGVQRWPSLLFLRDGQYVATLAGMLDWEDYLRETTKALAMPTSRVPGIGIPLVSAVPSGSSCH
ncbi:MAG TPA: hydrogenase [Ideonella sp.]|nr:hydrogenase [Ideonella sp.]